MAGITARWRDWEGHGLEHLVLTETDLGFEATSVVIGLAEAADGTEQRFAARYRILCDPLWRTREVEVELIGEPLRLSVTADGEGRWFDAAGAPLPSLDGAVDVDLAATPFTNTLPIRRLDLAAGASADILAAYVRFPELTLAPFPQHYVCLVPNARYRYESRGGNFTRDLDTDADGLVTIYPGLFRRVG